MPQGETKPSYERALDLYTQIIERETKIKLLVIKMSGDDKKTYEANKKAFLEAFNA